MSGSSHFPGVGRPSDIRGISLKGLLGDALGLGGKLIPGPLGTIASGAGQLIGGRRAGAATPIGNRGTTRSGGRFFDNATGNELPILRVDSNPRNPIGSTPIAPPTQRQQAAQNTAAIGLVCPAGFIPNKTRYVLKNGSVVLPGTKCVKRRRMNVGNATALRKGIRRQDGFVKLARRALKGTKFRLTSGTTRRAPAKPQTIIEHGSGSVVAR